MKQSFKLWHKILLTGAAFTVAIAGFMLKLPSVFRHIDKEMHSLFYFLAAAFLNILFAKRNLLVHALIFALLYAFSVAIEYAQEYSNSFLHKRIHGNADPEDIYHNLLGLIAFSVLWILYIVIVFVYKALNPKLSPDDAAGRKP